MPPELYHGTMSSEILIKGNLRKAKNWNKRFFVLRDGFPAKLEYYDNEKKWKSSSSKPRRRISLEKPWNIGKKKDSKHEFLIVIFTEDEYFSMAADNAETQEQWINALHRATKPEPGTLLFKHMWHVVLDNKELEGCKSNIHVRLHGPHRVCLTHDQMVFVHANNNGGGDRSRGEPIEILITHIRGCGHKEGLFFVEPGRASGIGSGILWMDLGDETMAANMHQTILQIMYALNQEEPNYRGRSYSSGSNSGRMRPVRSHHNNPPPSQIGMGKMATVIISPSGKRIRCDSLPATHMAGVNDSRLRTGSEGENTMHRPSRVNSMRCPGGSTSPRMRNRLLSNRRIAAYSHHHSGVAHSYATSLSGSYNGSSTASSSEHLNRGAAAMGETSSSCDGIVAHLPPSTSSPAVSDNPAQDENTNGQSPSQVNSFSELYRKGSFGSSFKNRSNNDGRSPTPEFYQQLSRSDRTDGNRHYCAMCLAHIPSSETTLRIVHPLSLVPPPPNAEPPPNPHGNVPCPASSFHEYANIPSHCRAQSLDDGLSTGTAASSLSCSPQQHLNIPHNQNQSNSQSNNSSARSAPSEEGQSLPTTSSSSTKPQSLISESFSVDDYAPMAFDGSSKYPHHKMSSSSNKSSGSGSSILAKLVSLAGVSPSSSSCNYTSMIISSTTAATPSDSKAQVKSQAPPLDGYLPMRSFSTKSVPQDIGSRRRSVPDASFRSHIRSSPPHSYSPEKSYEIMNAARNICQDCRESLASMKAETAEESTYRQMQPSAVHGSAKLSGDVNPESDKNVSEISKPTAKTNLLPPPVGESSKTSQPSPANVQENDYLDMQPLDKEIGGVATKLLDTPRLETSECNLLNMSSSPAESGTYFKETEMNDYLPMSPVSAAGLTEQPVRKSLVNSILSVAESPGKALPMQYPHQRKGNFSTNSLDRRGKNRSARPNSLGFRHTSNSSTRRAQPRPGKKNDNSPCTQMASPPTSAAQTRTRESSAGEYVNIDFSKAQEQSQSPHVVDVTKSKEKAPTPRLPPVQKINQQTDTEYTEMTFNPTSSQTNT